MMYVLSLCINLVTPHFCLMLPSKQLIWNITPPLTFQIKLCQNSRENILLRCKILVDDIRQFLVRFHLLIDEGIRLRPKVTNQILGDVIATDLVPELPHQHPPLLLQN